jgi:acetyl esterase
MKKRQRWLTGLASFSCAMALDPQTRKLLEFAARSRVAPYHELGPVAAREFYEKAAIALEMAPMQLHQVNDLQIEFKAPSRRLLIRHYLPKPSSWSDPQPALLFFHGGGFTIGSVQTHDRVCRRLAALSGAMVFSVQYRLAPEHPFPAAVDDAFAALAWLRDEAASLGVDAQRIAVGGDSAGGTLASACAIHARNQGWSLALQVLIYPGLAARQDSDSHRRMAQGYLLDATTIEWFFGHYAPSREQREDWRFAPLELTDFAGLAPVWIGHAQYDPLVDEGKAFAHRCREAGIAVEEREYAGMVHAFFQHGGMIPMALQAHQDAARALVKALEVES